MARASAAMTGAARLFIALGRILVTDDHPVSTPSFLVVALEFRADAQKPYGTVDLGEASEGGPGSRRDRGRIVRGLRQRHAPGLGDERDEPKLHHDPGRGASVLPDVLRGFERQPIELSLDLVHAREVPLKRSFPAHALRDPGGVADLAGVLAPGESCEPGPGARPERGCKLVEVRGRQLVDGADADR